MSLENKVAFFLNHVFIVKQFDYHAEGSNAPHNTVSVSKVGRKTAASAGKNERYISRDDAVLIVKSPGGENVRAVFTNIHPDLKKRVAFWNAITLVEKPPRPSVVTLYPERLSEEMWSEIVEYYDAEPSLMWGLLHVQAAQYVRPYRHTGSTSASVAVRIYPTRFFRRTDAMSQHVPSLKR